MHTKIPVRKMMEEKREQVLKDKIPLRFFGKLVKAVDRATLEKVNKIKK